MFGHLSAVDKMRQRPVVLDECFCLSRLYTSNKVGLSDVSQKLV